MNWGMFALISIFSISVANLFQKLAMKKDESDPVVSSIIFQFLVAILTGIFAVVKGFVFPPKFLIFPYFLISSFLYAFGTLFIFKAIKSIEASELVVVAGFSSIATIVSAFLFLNERLSLIQFFGVILVFLSVTLVSYKKKGVKFDKGLLFAFLGNSLYGFAVTNDAFILKSYQAISYTPIISFLPGLILCLFYFSKMPAMIRNLKDSISPNLGIYSFLYGIQAVTYYLALEKGALASQMSVIFKTEIVFTIILASIYLKERKNIPKKAIAAFFAITGTILLASF